MKSKVSIKALKATHSMIIPFGYCEIQTIEQYLIPDSYVAGPEWRCDNYSFSNYALSTGYNPIDYISVNENEEHYNHIKESILKLEKDLKENKIKLPESFNDKKEVIHGLINNILFE